jgi:hypothetical protein
MVCRGLCPTNHWFVRHEPWRLINTKAIVLFVYQKNRGANVRRNQPNSHKQIITGCGDILGPQNTARMCS